MNGVDFSYRLNFLNKISAIIYLFIYFSFYLFVSLLAKNMNYIFVDILQIVIAIVLMRNISSIRSKYLINSISVLQFKKKLFSFYRLEP